MLPNRRRITRVPVGFYINQYVGDDTTHRCFTTDLSECGLYMERLLSPLQRTSNIIQLELLLPDSADSIWAAGRVVYDRFDALFHGTAVHFTGMAETHRRWLGEWLTDSDPTRRFAFDAPIRRKPRVRVRRPTRSGRDAAAA